MQSWESESKLADSRILKEWQHKSRHPRSITGITGDADLISPLLVSESDDSSKVLDLIDKLCDGNKQKRAELIRSIVAAADVNGDAL